MSLVLIAVLLMFAVSPATAIPQPEATALILPALPIRSQSDAALSLPARPMFDRTTLAYAPEATPAVMTLSAPMQSVEANVSRDPTGPSSLALVATGLALALWVVRSRRWVR
jgi:hypothetical protein